MKQFYFACVQEESVIPGSVKARLSGTERAEPWRSGFLNSKHSAFLLPGVEVWVLPASGPPPPRLSGFSRVLEAREVRYPDSSLRENILADGTNPRNHSQLIEVVMGTNHRMVSFTSLG